MPGVASEEAYEELIGSLVDGRYRVLEAMASGSMGAVYKAERVPVGKLVAIKFLHAAFAKDSEFLSRFERETRVMSKLAHPNCVSVVDFGVFEGKPYLVMDYITGTTLRSVIDLGPLDPPRALNIARQITSGLAHAHAQGIVHRDVKPANIMISEEIGTGEHVRILDFGLARLRGAVGRDATQSNVVVGTPNYMAPEQTIGGGIIDARTDLYAVGVVLFEMIVGERPFQSEDTLALLGMHRAAPIPKLADRARHAPLLPDGLQDVIDKAMAKAPDDRYQTAIELADAIDRVGDEVRPPIIAPSGRHRRARTDPAVAPTLQVDLVDEPEPRKGKKPSSMAGIILALLVLGGGAYAAWYLTREPAKPTQTAAHPHDAAAVHGEEPPPADAAEASPPADAAPVAIVDAAPVVADGADVPAIDAPAAIDQGSAGSAAEVPDAGAGSGAGSGEQIEIEPDPESADHLAPKPPDDDESAVEAADAPKEEKQVEKVAPPPKQAMNLDAALALIRQGKTESAIAALRTLKPKNPKSAYIPFLLGNLYFDKRWWTVAIGEYRTAIRINAAYKKNGTLIRNAIRMLASNSTVGAARYLLQVNIGRPAIPALKYASTHSKNGNIKWNAAAVLRAMGVR